MENTIDTTNVKTTESAERFSIFSKNNLSYSTCEEFLNGNEISYEESKHLREYAMSLENPVLLTNYSEWMQEMESKKIEEEKMNEESPKNLAAKWLELKHDEEMAYRKRIEIEKKLVDILGCEDESSKTHNESIYKIKIAGKLNRTLDAKKWDEIKDEISSELSPIEYKPSLSVSKLKEMILKDPAAYRKMCKCITTKPGKPYITIVVR